MRGLRTPLSRKSDSDLCRFYLGSENGWEVATDWAGHGLQTDTTISFAFPHRDGRTIGAMFDKKSGQILLLKSSRAP